MLSNKIDQYVDQLDITQLTLFGLISVTFMAIQVNEPIISYN